MKRNYLKKMNNQSGFTLMETMITIFIFGIVMIGTTTMLRAILVNGRQGTVATGNIDQVGRLANTFENELRNGAYGVNGAYPVYQASDTQIIFFSTAPKGNGTVSKVRYYVTGSTLYKGITNPTGTTYNAANETITTLITSLSLGGNPLFYYYDGNYNGTGSALTQPVNINNVKFIKINLTSLVQLDQRSTGTFTVTGGAAIRNLKTNLGN